MAFMMNTQQKMVMASGVTSSLLPWKVSFTCESMMFTTISKKFCQPLGTAAGGAPGDRRHAEEENQSQQAGNDQGVEMQGPETVTDLEIGQVMNDIFGGGLCAGSHCPSQYL